MSKLVILINLISFPEKILAEKIQFTELGLQLLLFTHRKTTPAERKYIADIENTII